MNSHFETQILRSKLIAMTRLTQRAVDYSIKALQLGEPELCRAVFHSKDEMSSVRSWIANHGRALLDRGQPGHDPRFECAALRMAAALEVVYSAAIDIAQRSERQFVKGWLPVSAELASAGQFVNGLLRMCFASLLAREAQYANRVLENGATGQSLDLALYLARHQGTQESSAQIRFETAMIRHLDRIAGQTREIADAITFWLEENGGRVNKGEVAHKSVFDPDRRTSAAEATPLFKVDALSESFLCLGSTPRQAIRSNAASERSAFSRHSADVVSDEDFAPTRLMRLQQRVCELLVKNQQLRMALMAQTAEALQDQLC